VLRNTPRELAFGFLPLLAHPASGIVPEAHTLYYAVWFTTRGDWRENKLYNLAGDVLSASWIVPETPKSELLADSFISVEGADVRLSAVKKASRGEGLIVRLIFFHDCPSEVRLKLKRREIKSAFLCDARERDKEAVPVASGEAVLQIDSAIATVRLLF
jgi:alpha-mannosidase